MSEPSTWETVTIGESLELINGRAFKPKEWTTSGRPIIRIQNLNNPKAAYNYFAGDLPSKFSVSPGDLLFAWSGTPGTSFGAHIWKGPTAWLNQHIFRVVFPASVFDKTFLQYAINQNLAQYIGVAHGGAGLAHITKGKFEASRIPLPPLNEQKRILAKIEELFSELDAGEESLRAARRQLGVYRQSLLKQAFEGKLTETWRTRDRAAAYPQWRQVAVSDILSGKPTNGRSVKDRKGGYRVLRLTAIKDGVIDTSENKEGDWDAADAAIHVIRKGDFLVSRGNGSIRLVGRGGVVREDAEVAFPDTMIRLPLDLQLVDPSFFSYLWNSHHVREQLETSARTTAGIYKINQSLLTRYRLPLCSLPEQQEIVRILDEQFEVIEQNEREIDAALQRSEALRQAILKKAFTGQLVPQDPTDEPASELLARLRQAAGATQSVPPRGPASSRKKVQRSG